MIEGRVNTLGEARVDITLFGPDSGQEMAVAVVVDTGFNDYLTLPLDAIAHLGLAAAGSVDVQLADGTTIFTPVFAADVLWHGERMAIEIQLAAGNPLLGMRLMEGSRLTVNVREDGPVLIEEE